MVVSGTKQQQIWRSLDGCPQVLDLPQVNVWIA